MGLTGGTQTLDGLSRRLPGSGGGAPSVPSDIAGLQLWFKADTIGGLSDGDPVSTWADSSGNGRNATQSGSNRPLYRASVLNSRPACEGNPYFMTFSSVSLGTAHTVFMVLKYQDTSGAVHFGGASGSYCPYADSTDIYYKNGSVSVSVAHGGRTTSAGTMFSIVRSGTSVAFYKNASQIGTTQTLGNNTALTVAALFSYSDGTFCSPIYLSELFAYTSALSDSDRQAMETYLNTRYAIF